MSDLQVFVAVLAAVVLFIHALQGLSQELQQLGRERLRDWLLNLTRHRWQGFAVGGVATALVQSSSAVTAMTVALVDAGMISLRGSLAIMLGANVGTTATALLASLPMSLSARRAALGNLLFNTTGVVLMLPFVTLLADTVGGITETPAMAVALAHLLFNLGIALLFLPLLAPVTRLLAGWTPLRAGAGTTAAADESGRGNDPQ